MRASYLVLAALLMVMSIGTHTTVPAQSTRVHLGYLVIVNPANPIRTINRAFMRDIYLNNTMVWDGETARPADLPYSERARVQFISEVLNLTPSQLRDYWRQLLYTGKAVPPPEMKSSTDMIIYVLRNKGGIGYIPAGTDPQGAAVVLLR